MNFEEGNECENGDQQEKKGRWQQNHTGIAEVELEELRRKIKRNIETECTELEKFWILKNLLYMVKTEEHTMILLS